MQRNAMVLVFGTFDLLHPGHLAFLRAAAKHGELTVVITPDVRVKKQKGRAPHFNERERMMMVASLKPVSRVVLGDKGVKWTTVKRLAPDVICVGHDQDASHPKFLAQLEELKKQPKIIKLKPFKRNRYSSGKIKLEIHREKQKESRP